MVAFLDPRSAPTPTHVRRRPTIDPDMLAPLHQLCRSGRLYDVERWIQHDRPLQLAAGITVKGRRLTSALEVALEDGNQALVLLLLCNGYDPNLEPRCPLDLALRSRRWDLLDLLLEWGADPLRVSLYNLFDSYNSELWARFQALGVDLCAGHELASTLAHHTSNKPLFGFARRQREQNPRMQAQLNMALLHHVRERNVKGVQLCLWAGADPHAPALDLRDPVPHEHEDGEADPDRWLGLTSVYAACHEGEIQILERLGPDPSRDDFDELYETASNSSVVRVLARFAPPRNMGQIIGRQLFWMQGGLWSTPRSVDVLQALFDAGGRWATAASSEVNYIRRSLLKTPKHTFIDVMKVLASHDYCAPEVLQALGRTPVMRERMKEVGFVPLSPDDPGYYSQGRPTRSREVLAKFGVVLPKPPHRLPRYVDIGVPHSGGKTIQIDRATLFARVWSQSVESLAEKWGLSGRGLAKACERLKIPVPPRGYWARARSGQRVRRPSLPTLQPGEAEEITIYVQQVCRHRS